MGSIDRLREQDGSASVDWMLAHCRTPVVRPSLSPQQDRVRTRKEAPAQGKIEIWARSKGHAFPLHLSTRPHYACYLPWVLS